MNLSLQSDLFFFARPYSGSFQLTKLRREKLAGIGVKVQFDRTIIPSNFNLRRAWIAQVFRLSKSSEHKD